MKSFVHSLARCRGVRAAGLVALVWLTLGPVRALALAPDKDLLQYNCQTWSRRNGLPVNAVNAIAQTRDGYLWLGSASGLIRFDGVNFRLDDLGSAGALPSSVVNCLAASGPGDLWVGLKNSAFGFYNGHAFLFCGKSAGVGSDLNVHAFVEAKNGTLWAGTDAGLFQIFPRGPGADVSVVGIFTNNSPHVLCCYEDHSGRLWFGTANHGVYCWQDGKVTPIEDADLRAAAAFCFAEDPQGQIWIGTANGLFCFDANRRRKAIPALFEETRALLVDRHGVLWLGTSGRGLGRLRDGQYEFLQKSDGLANNYVSALAEDKEGSLWIGTRDGVSQLTNVKFPVLPATADGAACDVLAVAASPRGGVWIGCSLGATYFNGARTTYGIDAGLPSRYIKRVFEASDGAAYLVCRSDQLAVLSGQKTVAVYNAFAMVVGMAEDDRGVVVSAGGALYRASTNSFRPYEFKGEAPPMWWISNLAPGRDGAIWAATDNGIFRIHDGEFQHWPLHFVTEDTRVGQICEDSDGVVWAATLTGIVRLKDNQLRLINRQQGLFDDNICAIVPDDLGNLWVDSQRGIFCVSRQAMNDLADGKIERITCMVYNGPEAVKTVGKTVQESVACKSTDGRIWFPYPDGVVVVDPAHILTNRFAPPVHIDRILVGRREVPRTANVIVPPGNGELEIHFDVLSFIAPQKVHIQYQLQGCDRDWVDAGNRRMAFYANLKPGAYSFRVIAANADGVWNVTGDSLAVTMRPHYYQTVWFDVLAGGVVCAGLAALYLWRVRHLARKEQVLQQARDQLEIQVRRRTSELAETNASLEGEIKGHKRTTATLEQRTRSLEEEIEERKRMQLENERVHRELLETSRAAGMAEVATSVLHNVGNVLNSVNVSAGMLAEHLRQSKIAGVARMADLLQEHHGDLTAFLSQPGRADQVIHYLKTLGQHLRDEQLAMREEIRQLTANIEHIKKIVAMQQGYAKVSGVTEVVNPAELVEDSLRLNQVTLSHRGVKLVREFASVPALVVDKNKVLQILVNLVRNAQYACDESSRPDKQMTLRIEPAAAGVQISITDNGVGIPAENLTRIFSHGFTTRKNGHGFGLHGSALAAQELGGSLTAFSAGPGAGARFVLELPLQPPQSL